MHKQNIIKINPSLLFGEFCDEITFENIRVKGIEEGYWRLLFTHKTPGRVYMTTEYNILNKYFVSVVSKTLEYDDLAVFNELITAALSYVENFLSIPNNLL